jgi:chromosome segregation ATPase
MSEERWERIEQSLETLVTGQLELRGDVQELRNGVKELQSDVQELRDDVKELRTDVEELKTGHAELRTDVRELKTGQAKLRTDVQELQAGQLMFDQRLGRVEINQEDMKDQIKQIAEGHAAVLAAIGRGFEAQREMLDRRLAPLEQAMRRR